MPKIKIMIVDDHIVVRKGLKQLLETDDNIEVIADIDSGLNCLRALESCSPDIIFMDIRMPGINGIETTRLICHKYPNAKVIILTIYEDDQLVTDSIQAGAKGYILKTIERDELIKIVNEIINNQAYLDPKVASCVFKQIKQKKEQLKGEEKPELTLRELEILKHLVEGHTDRGISKKLFISEHTVRTHIKNIYRKLRVSSKSQAVAKALQKKIIDL